MTDTPQTAAPRIHYWHGPTDQCDGCWLDATEAATRARSGLDAGLREAATVVAATAEPAEDFEGEFVDYLVPADAIHGLRAVLALASSGEAAPVDGLRQHLDFCAGGEFCSLDDCLCRCHVAREEADDGR